MLKPIAALRAWFDGSWDDACLRCGMCCYEREVDEDGSVGIDFSAPCEFLDEDSRLCRVYDERFTRCERCRHLTPATVTFGKHLPPTCGYVLRFR